jgi:hypothetical protein
MSNQRLTFAQKMSIPLAPLDASSRTSAAAELPSSSLNSRHQQPLQQPQQPQQRPSFSQLMNAPLDAKSSSRTSAAAELPSSSLNSQKSHQQPLQQPQQRPSFAQLMNAPLDAKSSSRGSAAAELSSLSLNSRHQQPLQQAQQRLTFAERMTVPIDAAKSSSRASASLFLPLHLEEDEEPTDTTAHQPRFTGSRSPPVFFHKEYAIYGFLSNFYMPATFTDPISNIVFTSSEKYYMAAKAALAQNAKSFHDIMETNDPSTAKRIGSSFEVPTEWDRLKVGVMEYACYLKFSQNRDIGNSLLDTGDAELVEAAPNDSFWGIGINENKARHTERSMWPGKNFLGQVLMGVRRHLKDDTAPEASSQASQIISNFVKRLIHPQPSSQTSSLADVRLAGVPEVDDDGYANIVELLTEYANSEGSFDMTDKRNIRVNASKIEQLMYDKYLSRGGNPNISLEEHENMRQKIATKYIPRFIKEQQQLQLPRGQRQHQQQQQHGIYSMGFPEADVERALAQTNGNEERAIEILISQQQPQQPQQPRQQSQRQPQQQQPPRIRSMGFPEADVQVALSKAKGDEEQAIKILLHNLVTTLLTDVRENNKSWINREDVEVVVMENLNTSNVYGESKTKLFAIPRPKGYIEEGTSSSELATYIREMPEIKVGGAGNCLFFSLVGSLTNLFEHLGDEASLNNPALNNQASMREAIVDFESKHYNQEIFYQAAPIDSESPQLQKLYLNDPNGSVGEKEVYYDEENVHKYFNSMAKDGTYGTEVEIMAAARMFGVTIFVQIEQGNGFVRYSSSSNPDETKAIYLYKADMHNHYDWKDPYSEEELFGGKQKQQKQQQKSRKINCKKLSKRYSRYKKNLYKYSSPTQAQKMATKYLGKTAKLYPANNPVKKYRICDPVSKKWVNFGQLGYEDYTRHKNKTRRHNYLTRTANMRGNWKSNKYSANNLSRKITW